jgi:hypothetical protein
MTGQAIVLLVIALAAGSISLLYAVCRCRHRPSGEAGGSSHSGVAAAGGFQEEEAIVREEEPVVQAGESERSSGGGEGEREKLEAEVAPTPPREEFAAIDAFAENEPLKPSNLDATSGSKGEGPQSACKLTSEEAADLTVAEHIDQVPAKNAQAASGDNLVPQLQAQVGEDSPTVAGVPIETQNAEEMAVANAAPGLVQSRADICADERVKPLEASQTTYAPPPAGAAVESSAPVQASDQEDAAVELPREDNAGAGALDAYEVSNEDVAPSVPAESGWQGQEPQPRSRKPREYEGLDRTGPKPHRTRRREPCAHGEDVAEHHRSLPIAVRLRFDRDGYCKLSLIAKRSAGLPDVITVSTQPGELELQAMEDEWFQDVFPDNMARILIDGAVWVQKDGTEGHTWSLSGRPLYVLAAHADMSGFVSQPCLQLGREHVVLCKAEISKAVEDEIKETGATFSSILDQSRGVPQGWLVFRGVIPTVPVTPLSGADLFNVLRPVPRIEISLEGGLRLERTKWLEGYPPAIKVYGDPHHTAKVFIDGHAAARGVGGGFQAPGWDSLGTHSILCSSVSKSYTIVQFPSNINLEPWEAYSFPVGHASNRRIAICGPLVRCAASDAESRFESVIVPETNRILLGQSLGQIVLAESASGIRGTPLIASPPFSPVWALPRDPLHCDKKATCVVLIGHMLPPDVPSVYRRQPALLRHRSIDAWCRFILDAGRKRLRTEPDTETVRELWLEYKLLARRILRGRR